MKHLFFGFLLIGILQTTYAGVTGDKGNGGDIVKCQENGLTVYRTLDSVVSEGEPFFNGKSYDSSLQALNAITNHFGTTLPLMKARFNDFLNTFEKKVNRDRSTFWIKAKLQQVADENLYVLLPENCEADPIQSVVLVKEVIKRYYYDPTQLSRIESVDDELSWILVHEFLRDYLDDADIIRIVNAYLHSSDFIEDDEEEVQAQFKTFGINNRYAVSLTYSKHLKTIAELKEALKILEGTAHKISEFKKIDFSELSRKEKRKLKGKMYAVERELETVREIILYTPPVPLYYQEYEVKISLMIVGQENDLYKLSPELFPYFK